MSIGFSIEKGKLIIKELSDDRIIWMGKPLDCSVENLLEYPQKGVCFVLLSRKDGPRLYPEGPMKAFKNLICVNSHGETIWTADLPSSGVDFYTKVIWSKDLRTDIFQVDLNLKDNSLVAFSYTGFLVSIEPDNGKIISSLLIK